MKAKLFGCWRAAWPCSVQPVRHRLSYLGQSQPLTTIQATTLLRWANWQ